MKLREFHGCGCCGRETGETRIWCEDCSKHVNHWVPLWEGTYQAQYREPCPYQVNAPKKRAAARRSKKR